MAVTKIWPVCSSTAKTIDYIEDEMKTTVESSGEELERSLADEVMYSDLDNVIDYAENGLKTERSQYVSAIGCSPSSAAEEFQMTKDRFGKQGSLKREKVDGETVERTVLALHCIMSFGEGEVTPELAHEIGVKFAERAWGENFQVVIATHTNTENIHNHFVVNTVGLDGKILHQNKNWLDLRKITDALCKEYNLSVVKEPKRGWENRNYQVYQSNQSDSGKTTRITLLRDIIDEAVARSTSVEEFVRCLEEQGCRCRVGEQFKYWSVTPPGYERPIRLYHLGMDYSNVELIQKLNRNQQLDSCGMFFRERPDRPTDVYVYQSARVWAVRREWKMSYKALWQTVCELYGFTPERPPRYHYDNYVPPWELQKTFVKMEKLNDQAIMLAANNINTQEDLLRYEAHCKEQLNSLEWQRNILRNELRKAPEEKKDEVRAQIQDLTQQMAAWRKDLRMCHEIDERSNLLAPAVQKLDQRMEELEKEKGFDRSRWDEPSVNHINLEKSDNYYERRDD